RIGKLESAPPPKTGPSPDAIQAPLRRELQALGKRIESLEEKPAPKPGPPPEAIQAPLKADLQALAKRIERLEKAPAPKAGPDPEGIQAPLMKELQTLGKRIETLEKAPSPQTVQGPLKKELQVLTKKIEGLEKAPAPEAGISEETVKDLIQKAINNALKTIKGMIEQIKPTMEAAVEKKIDTHLQKVPTKMEMVKIQEKAGAGALKGASVEAMKPEIVKEARRAVTGVLESPKTKNLLRDAFGKETFEKAVVDIIESDVFRKLLNSDDMKELLDERFKTLRIWLKNEEIPKQVKKLMQ
ncbi:MAG: hypothetical protein ACYTHM_20960, partial [Planctomycetota bacterium]